MTLVLRLVKGSALTYAEMDDNLTYLDSRISDVESDTVLTSQTSSMTVLKSIQPFKYTGSNSIFSTTPAAGVGSLNATESIFFGTDAGSNTININYSNFFGKSAGYSATSAYGSNFLGQQSGYSASGAFYSNFLGSNAGSNATEAYDSNFLGRAAGYGASKAKYSTFIGSFAGYNAISASNSIFIGPNTGYNIGGTAVTSLKSNNIIIGTNITMPDGSQDSINIGALIFATGSYSDINSTTFSGSANGKVGINQPLPKYSLDISGSGNYTNSLTVTGSLQVLGNGLFTGSVSDLAITSRNTSITGYSTFAVENNTGSYGYLSLGGSSAYPNYTHIGSSGKIGFFPSDLIGGVFLADGKFLIGSETDNGSGTNFQVSGSGGSFFNSGSFRAFYAKDTSNNSRAYIDLQSSGEPVFVMDDSNGNYGYIGQGGQTLYLGSDKKIDFYPSNSLALTITETGKTLIGSGSDNGSGANLQVIGSATISNGLTVTGSVTINNILTMVTQSTLPAASSYPYSFAVSSSGVPYFSNGNAWNALY